MLDVSPTQILAAFTNARRVHEGLTQSTLARRLGIRTDQVSKAENCRACGAKAARKLREWNELDSCSFAGPSGPPPVHAPAPRTVSGACAATEGDHA